MIPDWNVLDVNQLVDVSTFVERPPRKFEREKSDVIHGKAFSRYNEPKFKELFYEVKNKVEYIIQDKVYPSYYFDRFYFNGSKMDRHVDRGACEISVSLNISHNLDYDWGLWFDNGEAFECFTKPGDAVIYRGVEVPHWRNKMVGKKDSYFHQIFLHYVRRDGEYLEFAFDPK